MAPYSVKKINITQRERRDLNPQPLARQANTLPIKLLPLLVDKSPKTKINTVFIFMLTIRCYGKEYNVTNQHSIILYNDLKAN